MQAASDIFLGWQRTEPGSTGSTATSTSASCGTGRSPSPIEPMLPRGMRVYGELCGWTPGPGARPVRGPRSRIAAYLGGSDMFDQAIADFADAYADQNERDYEALVAAAASGRITAEHGV